MRIDQMVGAAVTHVMGRVVRRAIAILSVAIFGVVAVYHFTVAGIIALDGHFGTLDARLIVGGVYGALALVSLAVVWGIGRKSAGAGQAPALGNTRELKLIMLVEAVMLGYSLARKRERTS